MSGSVLATISDETSVRRLVKPSAHTFAGIETRDARDERTRVSKGLIEMGYMGWFGGTPKLLDDVSIAGIVQRACDK